MSIMQEAIPKDEWEAMDRGFKPKRRAVRPRPEPKLPEIEDLIRFDDIPLQDFQDLEYARWKTIKNDEGVVFNGYDVKIILSPNAAIKRRVGRPKKVEEGQEPEEKILAGWMIEGEFLKFFRLVKTQINPNVVTMM